MGELAARVLSRARGRAQHVARDGTLYISRGYSILRSRDRGTTWQLDCALPAGLARRALARVRLAARATRSYVQALSLLPDGARLAIARAGIYRAEPGSREMRLVHRVVRGSRPIQLCVDGSGRVLFGEYGPNPGRHEIHVFASTDGRGPFEVAYTFPAGQIRHVHNLLHDPFCDGYWVLVGDYGHEPGIALADRAFSSLEWLGRGSQQVRAVSAIVEEHALIYGTDTEIEASSIVRLDKASGRRTVLQELEGSSLSAARFGGYRIVSSCTEPGTEPIPRFASVWGSADGERWQKLRSYRRSPLHQRWFQFGTVVLAESRHPAALGMWSGQAVHGQDGRVEIVELGDSPAP